MLPEGLDLAPELEQHVAGAGQHVAPAGADPHLLRHAVGDQRVAEERGRAAALRQAVPRQPLRVVVDQVGGRAHEVADVGDEDRLDAGRGVVGEVLHEGHAEVQLRRAEGALGVGALLRDLVQHRHEVVGGERAADAQGREEVGERVQRAGHDVEVGVGVGRGVERDLVDGHEPIADPYAALEAAERGGSLGRRVLNPRAQLDVAVTLAQRRGSHILQTTSPRQQCDNDKSCRWTHPTQGRGGEDRERGGPSQPHNNPKQPLYPPLGLLRCQYKRNGGHWCRGEPFFCSENRCSITCKT